MVKPRWMQTISLVVSLMDSRTTTFLPAQLRSFRQANCDLPNRATTGSSQPTHGSALGFLGEIDWMGEETIRPAGVVSGRFTISKTRVLNSFQIAFWVIRKLTNFAILGKKHGCTARYAGFHFERLAVL